MEMSEWRKVLTAWAGTEEHRKVVSRARECIRQALAKCRKPYVAFSGGKDSTCVLSLVLEQAPETMVLHWDYGPYYIPREMEQEFIDHAKAIGARNLRVETSAEYERLGRKAINVLGREYLGKLVPKLRDEEGYDLVFLGLRAEESVKRRLKTEGSIWREKKMLNCAPIRDWSWRDVWAYIFAHDLPYASVYDLYAPVVGIQNLRLTTFFDPEFDKFGSPNLDGILMWRHRHLDPGD